MNWMMHTIVLCNQPIIDIYTDIFFYFASACKWTNTGNCHRFLWVFASFCLSPCSHTGSFYRVQLLFLFGVPVFLLTCLYHFRWFLAGVPAIIFFFFSEHLFSFSFFLCYFGASVLISFCLCFWLPEQLFSYSFFWVFSEHMFSYSFFLLFFGESVLISLYSVFFVAAASVLI